MYGHFHMALTLRCSVCPHALLARFYTLQAEAGEQDVHHAMHAGATLGG